jgi:hypothetical protein
MNNKTTVVAPATKKQKSFLGMKNFIRSTDDVHLAGCERNQLQKRTFFGSGATIG